MANLLNPVNPLFPDVYQIEVLDRVKGGPGGTANRQAEQLLERTAFLKKQIDDAVSGALTVMFASKLKVGRTLSMTGDGSWNVTFDGSSNVSAALTLANSGVVAGTWPMTTVDAKGRVTAGRALLAADIPALDYSKITTGKPATLAAAGITDAQPLDAELSAIAALSATGMIVRSAAGAAVARSIAAGTGITVAYGDGVAGNPVIALTSSGVVAGTYPKVTVDTLGRVTAGAALAAADIPALDWSKITTGKPTTLAAAGITDGALATHGHTLSLGDGAAQKISWGSGQRLDVVAGTNVNIVYDDVAKKMVFSTTGVLSGNADTASRWQTPRTLSLTGDATGSMSVDGSANVSAALTLSNSGVVAGTWPMTTVDAKGRVIAGRALLAADIPALDYSKITTGKPATLAAAGITDAQPLDAELSAIAALSATGMIVRSAAGGAVTRSIAAGAGISVSNADGVAGNPVIALTNSGVVSGTYPKVTVDALGRVTSGAALVTADIPAGVVAFYSADQAITAAQFGGYFAYKNPSSPGVFTLPSPAGSSGKTLTFHNRSSTVLTLSVPEAMFSGPAGSGASTLQMLPNTVVTVISDETNYVVTNASLNSSGAAPIYANRAWVTFNGTGTVAIRGSGNVSSITDNGVGDYTVNFITPMPDTNYAIGGACSAGAGSAVGINNAGLFSLYGPNSRLVSSVRVCTCFVDHNNDSTVAFDSPDINVIITR